MTRRSGLILIAVLLLTGFNLGWLSSRLVLKGERSTEASVSQENGDIDEGLEPGLGGSEEALYRSLARQYEQFHPVNRTFELASKVVSRAVVHIVASKVQRSPRGAVLGFFEESGSGVIVRSEDREGRFVLTNHHVIDGAKPTEIRISMQDGRVLHPVEVLSDHDSDVAVLVLSVTDLPAARLGNSDDAVPGTWVLALGSPFGLANSVSQGIISARGRQEGDLFFEGGVANQDFLQTDAAINPGNSGGPLINLRGEVVGINTAIASHGGGNEGVGYSIPANLARWAMGQLLRFGRVKRGAIGIETKDVEADEYELFGLERPQGTRVLTVAEDSPARISGLRPNDIVVRYNSILVRNTWHLINLISTTPIGEIVEIQIVRGGRAQVTQVEIADLELLRNQLPPALPETGPGNYLIRP